MVKKFNPAKRVGALGVALAALLTLPAAQALTPAQVAAARASGALKEVRLTGSSSMRYLVASYLQLELAQPGTFDVYFDTPSGANHRAYAFLTKVAIGGWPIGTPVLITKRDQGDAQQAVVPLLNGGDASQTHLFVDGACSTAPGGVSPAVDIQAPGFLCTATSAAKADAGFTDLEPSFLQAIVNGGSGWNTASLPPEPTVQAVFGIAVNKKLYLALQKAQGLVAVSATQIDEAPALMPNLPGNFIAGTLTGQMLGSSSATNKGWNLVIPAGVDSNIDNKRINVCRGIPGSGAQAVANLYFANNPCGGTANQYPVTVGTKTSVLAALGSLTTRQTDGMAGIEACLAAVEQLPDPTGGAYGFGVMGAGNPGLSEINGVTADKGYRFVKLSHAAPSREDVNAGNYNLVYDAYLVWPRAGELNAPSADVLALLTQMRSRIGAADVLARMDTDLQEGYLALPSSVPASWSRLDPLTKAFTAHSNRISANSCSFSRMTK